MTNEELNKEINEKTINHLIDSVGNLKAQKIVTQGSLENFKKINLEDIKNPTEKGQIVEKIATLEKVIQDFDSVITYIEGKIKEIGKIE